VRFIVHDYCGHPFQVQLSRHLATRGHHVTHIYFAENPGPKGTFEDRPDNPPGLQFIGITLGRPIMQTALLARHFNDIAYGRQVARIIRTLAPDSVISGNTPTKAQKEILKACKAQDIRFAYWLQDIYSVAVSKLVSEKLGFIGKAVGWYYKCLDRRQLRASDSIVAISEDFLPLARSWAGGNEKVSVIENWAAIDDIAVGTKDNDWSREYGLHRDFAFVYTGTLGRKHNPKLLLRLAELLGSSRPTAVVVAVAQGVGVKELRDAKAAQQLDALKLFPLQPAAHFGDVLATADILIAMIKSDASIFSVPSKVQSYMCAGRPILLSAPKENLAARTVAKVHAGIVIDPSDEAGFVDAARHLRDDPQLRAVLGANGRAYAESAFDMRMITDKFESILIGPAFVRQRMFGHA
jgi:glycosyltransferase involved in cell wall biosynthesis